MYKVKVMILKINNTFPTVLIFLTKVYENHSNRMVLANSRCMAGRVTIITHITGVT